MTHQQEYTISMKELALLGRINQTLLFHKFGIIYKKVSRMLLQKLGLANGDVVWPFLVAYWVLAVRYEAINTSTRG